MKAAAHAKASPASTTAPNPALATFLQRTCSCGGSGGVSGECTGCASERRFGSTGLQPKLTVSAPHDIYEQEADRLADEVMSIPSPGVEHLVTQERPSLLSGADPPIYRRMTSSSQREMTPGEVAIDEEEEETIQTKPVDLAGHLQRQSTPEGEEEEGTVQARRSQTTGTPMNSTFGVPDFHDDLGAERSSGEPMDAPLRSIMESRFGVDFGHVRIHRGQRAANLARAVHAQAFTLGEHIYFGSGRYQPSSTAGRHLLAHELVHTIQQCGRPTTRHRDRGAGASMASPALGQTDASLPADASLPLQRQADTFVPPRLPDGELVHATVLPALGKRNPGLFTEVKIPGAKDLVRGESQAGIADLYKAVEGPETTIAVIMVNGKPEYLESRSKPVKGHKLRSELLKEGKKFPHKKEGAPRGAEEGGACDGKNVDVCRIDKAPKKILLGDLKPASGLKFFLGKGQISDYRAGIKITSAALNTFIGEQSTRADPAKTTWSPETGVLSDLEIPDVFTLDRGEPIMPLRLYDDRKEGEAIPGLAGPLVVYEQPDGIWSYEWVPKDYPPELRETRLPKLTAALNRIDLLIGQLRAPSKKTAAGKALPGREGGPGGHESSPPGTRHAILQRRAEFKPVQWQADFENWRATEATAFLGSKGVGLLPTGKGTIPESEEAKNARVAAALVNVQQRTGLPMALPQPVRTLAKGFERIRLWVRWGSIFGRMRTALGGLFTKIHSFYEKAREKFDELRGTKSGNQPSSGGSIARTIFRSAFQIAVTFFRVMVERVSRTLKISLGKATGVLLESFFGDENLARLETAGQSFEELANDIEKEVREDVGERVKLLVEPYEEIFTRIQEIEEWLGDVGKLVSAVKWGLRVIQCLTPPGWGCLKIALGPLNDALAAKVVGSCWFQLNFIKPLLSEVDLFKELPGKVSGLILGQVKEMVREFPFGEEAIEKAFPQPKVDTNVTGGDIACDPNYVTRAQREMNKLVDEYGRERIRKMISLLEAGGVAEDRAMTVDDVTLLRGLLEKIKTGDIAEEELADALTNLREGRGSGVKDIDELLERLGVGSGGGGKGAGAGQVKVVPFDKAKYSGPTGGEASRAGVRVISSSLSHKLNSEQIVTLEGSVDGKPVMMITGVPAKVTEVSDEDIGGVPHRVVWYTLGQSVAFRHDVPGVPGFVVAVDDAVPGDFLPVPSRQPILERAQ